jgi:hypothetical protein
LGWGQTQVMSKTEGILDLQLSGNLTRLQPQYSINGEPVNYVNAVSSNHMNTEVLVGVKLIEMNRLYIGYSSPIKSDSIFSFFNQQIDYRYHSLVFINRLSLYKNLYLDLGLNYTQALSASQFNQFGKIDLLLEPDFRRSIVRRIIGIGYDFSISENMHLNTTWRYVKSLQSLDLDLQQNLTVNNYEISMGIIFRN